MKRDERACPACAETIKKAAKVCKHCGATVEPERKVRKRSPYQGPRNDAERKVQKNSQIGCAAAVVGMVLLVAYCSPEKPKDQSAPAIVTDSESGTKDAAETSSFDDTYKQSVWITMSQDAIKKRLRDPDSAEFRQTGFYSGGTVPVVCGEVNARNGFGGYIGYQKFIASGQNTDIAFLASDYAAGESIEEVWEQLCVKAERDEAYVR